MDNIIEQIKNGAFKDDSGRVQLLRILKDKELHHKFLIWLNCTVKDGHYCIPLHYITQDGPLVDAVIEFLEKEWK